MNSENLSSHLLIVAIVVLFVCLFVCLFRYTVCLALLLPSLEHGLRRVFACVNDCPERVITAEV